MFVISRSKTLVILALSGVEWGRTPAFRFCRCLFFFHKTTALSFRPNHRATHRHFDRSAAWRNPSLPKPFQSHGRTVVVCSSSNQQRNNKKTVILSEATDSLIVSRGVEGPAVVLAVARFVPTQTL
jgi:hypothetical protein